MVPSESSDSVAAAPVHHGSPDLASESDESDLPEHLEGDVIHRADEGLGWGGNEFSIDPQYGFEPGNLLEEPSSTSGGRSLEVFVAALGDACQQVSGPSYGGVVCRLLHLSEGEAIGRGHTLPEHLRAAAAGAGVKYVVVAPDTPTFLRADRRHAPRQDPSRAVARGRDKDVQRIFNATVAALPGWKALVVTPGSSTYSFGSATSRSASSWTTARLQAAVYGGRPGTCINTQARSWPAPPEPVSSPRLAAPPSADLATGRRPWVDVVAAVAADFLCNDLARLLDFSAVAAGTEVTEHGQARRHVARGPVPLDAKTLKRFEDESCLAGMRDPAALASRWPALWAVMDQVTEALVVAREADASLQNLAECFGQDPAKSPPSAKAVAAARRSVGATLGLQPGDVEEHGAFCQWRHRLVEVIQARAGDPDVELVGWLRDGAPMGIQRPVRAGGGIFPAKTSERSCDPASVLARPALGNHPSFRESQGLPVPPGHSAVQEYLDKGFALLFRAQADAEAYLGSKVAPAPLGTVSKAKENGTMKHRVIMDLRANGVNAAVATPERQVLPTLFQHALDVASLGTLADLADGTDVDVSYMVLDFKDAFMSLGLHVDERAFNTCSVELELCRHRPALYDGEPRTGHFLVWTVLGFGGKPNPLVFARAASFACRAAQAMLRPAPDGPGCRRAAVARLQCYVDDPIATVVGSETERLLAIDLVINFWLVLGIDLAWAKGSWTTGSHKWIGALFERSRARPRSVGIAGDPPPEGWTAKGVAPPPAGAGRSGCVVSAPPAFLDELYSRLGPLAAGKGHTATSEIEALLGRCGRLAYVVPAARPYVTSLWGAFSASKAAARGQRKEAPPNRHANRRFAAGARWLRTLIAPPPTGLPAALLPLEHHVVVDRRPITLDGPVVHVDASPWGAGAVLLLRGRPVEYSWCAWAPRTAEQLGQDIGSPAGQTAWEYLAILLVLLLWGARFRDEGLAILGDNMASLNSLLTFRGRRDLARVTRELAWRKVRHGWRYAVGHLPTERNTIADSLSRVAAPAPHTKAVPPEVGMAELVLMPDQDGIWIVPV